MCLCADVDSIDYDSGIWILYDDVKSRLARPWKIGGETCDRHVSIVESELWRRIWRKWFYG